MATTVNSRWWVLYIVEEFVCITVRSTPGENRADFSARLSRFWTHMLRTLPDEFERVYAETTAFEQSNDRLTRQYALEEGVVASIVAELAAAGLDYEPVDHDNTYSKYETVPPEWMQIEH